jgi:hypothetical protein
MEAKVHVLVEDDSVLVKQLWCCCTLLLGRSLVVRFSVDVN